jgi:hypothetical protein
MVVVPALLRIAHCCPYRGTALSKVLFAGLHVGLPHPLTLLVAVVLASRLAVSVSRK